MQHARAVSPAVAAGNPPAEAPALPSRWWVNRRDMALTIAATGLLATLALTPLPPFAGDVAAAGIRRQLVTTGATIAYSLWLLVGRRLPRPTPLDLPVLATLAAAAAAITTAADRRGSLDALLTVLPVAPLLVVIADQRLLRAATLRRVATATAVIVALPALWSVVESWGEWLRLIRAVDSGSTLSQLLPPSVPRVHGTGSHPNVVGSLLAMSVPWCLATLAEPRRPERWWGAISLMVILPALFFTLSRAAWLAALAGGVVTGAGFAIAGGRLRRFLGRGGALALTAALLTGAALVIAGSARPDWLFRDSLTPRADMRRVGLEIAREHPLTGAGPGSYVALYAEHGGAYPFAAVHSHNSVVQIAADYGVIGLAAAALLLAVTAGMLAAIVRLGSVAARRRAAVTAGVISAFAVHAMADSPHLFPELLTYLLMATALPLSDLAAVQHARPAAIRRLTPRLAALPAGLLLLAGLALIPWWWHSDRAEARHEDSVRLASRGHWDQAVTAAEKAVRADDGVAAYHLQLGAVRAGRYMNTGDPADRAAAIAAYQRALAIQPRNGAARVDLAALLLDADEWQQARAVVDSLRAQAGHDNLLQLAYAVLIQRLGSEGEAVETYAGLLALNPSLALTPFWRDDRWRSDHYSAIVDQSLERAAELTGPGPAADRLRTTIRVLTGRGAADETELREQVAAHPEDTGLRVSLGRMLTAAGRLEEAGPLLQGAVQRTGDSADARAALGDWYAAGGDLARARSAWAAAAYLGDARAGNALGNSYPDGEVPGAVIARQGQLLQSVWIGRFYLLFQTFRFTFMRHEPVPIIIAGDWLDALPDDLPAWQDSYDRWRAATAPPKTSSERGR